LYLARPIPIATGVTTNAIVAIGAVLRARGRVAKSGDDSGLYQGKMHPWLSPWQRRADQARVYVPGSQWGAGEWHYG